MTKDFEYKEVVLEFTEIEGHKSRENMARIILDLLCELDIESKLISITSDTTSNNKTLVEEVETGLHDQFEEEPTLGTLCFYRQSSYIWCIAYVLNQIVKKILKTLNRGDQQLAEAALELVSSYQYLNTADSALARLQVLAIWISQTPKRKS